MSKKKLRGNVRPPGRQRQLSIRGELRREPDLRKLARAVISLAMAQAEADAQAQVNGEPTAADPSVRQSEPRRER